MYTIHAFHPNDFNASTIIDRFNDMAMLGDLLESFQCDRGTIVVVYGYNQLHAYYVGIRGLDRWINVSASSEFMKSIATDNLPHAWSSSASPRWMMTFVSRFMDRDQLILKLCDIAQEIVAHPVYLESLHLTRQMAAGAIHRDSLFASAVRMWGVPNYEYEMTPERSTASVLWCMTYHDDHSYSTVPKFAEYATGAMVMKLGTSDRRKAKIILCNRIRALIPFYEIASRISDR